VREKLTPSTSGYRRNTTMISTAGATNTYGARRSAFTRRDAGRTPARAVGRALRPVDDPSVRPGGAERTDDGVPPVGTRSAFLI
jgi:hypothetical protein